MSESKNFRITLHLTHFFQDHRSLSKIFISKAMKNVSDLEDHVQNIFKIKDFYFMAHGHYIPPSEDIRILQPDDIIIAMPANGTVATSTPIVYTINCPLVKEKQKGRHLEYSLNTTCDLEDNSNVCIKKKKKKKRKPDQKIMQENVEESQLINEDDVQEYNTQVSIDNSSKAEYQEENKCINGNKTKKRLKEQNNDSDFQNVNDLSHSNSVKSKVLYFEKQSMSDDLVDKKSAVSGTNSCIDNEIKIQEKEISKNILVEELLQDKEKQDDSFKCINNKNLFVQKRKSDLICYDLPKKSNIVKSILVSKIPNAPNLTVEHSNHNTTTYICENETRKNFNYPHQENCDSFIGNEKNYITDNKLFQNSKKLRYNEFKNNNDVEQPTFQFQKVKNNSNAKKTMLGNSNYVSSTINSNIIINTECLNTNEGCIINDMIENKDVKLTKETKNLKSMKGVDGPENKSIQFIETVDINQPGIFSQNDSQDLDIISHTNFSQTEEQSISEKNFSATEEQSTSEKKNSQAEEQAAEKNISIDDTHCSSICDTASFITKRKRKRSHRKRKSKLKVDNSLTSLTTEVDYDSHILQFPVASAVHIKFNDDDEPVSYVERTEKNSETCPENLIAKIVKPTEITQNLDSNTIVKTEELLHNNEIEHITIDDVDELDNKESISSTNLLSEDTILKSPSMTSTKPKIGDIVAFKMLRLNESYTPEVSKFIIGEILTYNESTSNVDLKIIGGLDQCAQPGGKFSIENNEDFSNIKSYSWGSLIEPRLIFP